ncbi:MAG: hypothetical protein KTV77_01950 [Wolbachia endosymbiont of Fragariocoptes setiger]|nr:hypothetical protein [Wolbachia endosymbiont of Fragariocoptes setiger]
MNAIFYITCVCVLTASIVDYFILDKLYENFNIINRQKISEELIKKAFYQEKDVNVIYNNEITYQQKIYDQVIVSSTKNKKVVYREESYIITDPFKKKIISLKYKSDNKYLVAGYINLQNKNIGLKDFKTDFFSKKKKGYMYNVLYYN